MRKGLNVYRQIHAEEEAIDKLRFNNSNKLIKIDILVVRISKDSNSEKYKLLNSKPCALCIYNLNNVQSKGYKIRWVYYSDNNGNIQKEKLKNIQQSRSYATILYRQLGTPKKIKQYI